MCMVLHMILWPSCGGEQGKGTINDLFYGNKLEIHLKINICISILLKSFLYKIKISKTGTKNMHFWVITFPWMRIRAPPQSPSHNKCGIIGDSGYNGISASSPHLSLWLWSKPKARPQIRGNWAEQGKQAQPNKQENCVKESRGY